MGLLKICWSRLCAYWGLMMELFSGLRRTGQTIEADEDDAATGANGAVAISLRRESDSYRDPDRAAHFTPSTASRADEPYHEDDQT